MCLENFASLLLSSICRLMSCSEMGDQSRLRLKHYTFLPEKHLWAEKYETSLSDVLTGSALINCAVIRTRSWYTG